MFYIIGLGNPGEKYSNTRHNVGRMATEAFADCMGAASWSKSKHAKALYAWVNVSGADCELLLPETFMNNSGDTVRYVADKHDAKPEEIIVVHDEIDLPFGEIKIVQGRGAGGNNGVKSIIEKLGSKDFIRIRVGIAPKSFWTGKVKRPQGGGPLERFVLKPFTQAEKKKLPEVFEKVKGAIESVISEGVEIAMNKSN